MPARFLEALVADVRFALRHFGRRPIPTIIMLAVLSLGIGVNTALFTVIHSVLTQPPGSLERDDSLVRIRGLQHMQDQGRTVARRMSEAEFREHSAQTELFSQTAAWYTSTVALDAGNTDRGAMSASASYVTDDYFSLLGTQPVLGPGLPRTDPNDAAAAAVAVISYRLWDERFGRSPDVIGSTITVEGTPLTIVGVAPLGFLGASSMAAASVWLPLAARPLVERDRARTAADSAFLSVVARLRPGVDPERATQVVDAIAQRRGAYDASPTGAGGVAYYTTPDGASGGAPRRPRAVPSADVVPVLAFNEAPDFAQQLAIVATTLGTFTLLILLIACTNVSGLLSGLAVARRREIAVRLSLGASRLRVLRQLLTESVVLAVAAAGLGAFVLWALIRVVVSRVPELPLAVDWPVLGLTFGFAILTGLVFGVSPALHATRLALAGALKDSAAAIAGSRSRLQRAFVVAQVAFSQPLLITFIGLVLAVTMELGSRRTSELAENIVVVRFDAFSGGRAADQARAALERLVDRLAATPGVAAATLHSEVSSTLRNAAVHLDDRAGGEQEEFTLTLRHVRPGFFKVAGRAIVRGRDFDASDRPYPFGTAIVIDSDVARRLWGDTDPIGRRIQGTQERNAELRTYEVVGVVEPEFESAEPPEPGAGVQAYAAPLDGPASQLLVRTHAPAEPFISTIRALAREEAPGLPIANARTRARIDADDQRAVLMVSSALASGGLLVLFLSAIGLYAVVAFAVAQRTREIAIRMALGARATRVVRLFFTEGVRLSLFGLAIGLPLTFLALRLLPAEVRDIPVSLPLLFGVAAAGVLVVAALSSWLPARRAAGIDPASALRGD